MTTATRRSPHQYGVGSGASDPAGAGVVATIARQAVQDLLAPLTTRLLDAAADRALSTVKGLTRRLEAVDADGGTGGGLKAVLTGDPVESDAASDREDGDGDEKPSILGAVGNGFNFIVQHAIALLDLVTQWISRAWAAAKLWLDHDSGDDDSADSDADSETDADADADAENDQHDHRRP